MTTNVVTVSSEAGVEEIATLLLERHISGVPVVDGKGRVIGLVSEGDLIRRSGGEAERRHAWWLRLLSSSSELAEEYVKTHGRRAEDLMTRDVITVSEETPVAEIAQLLEERRIKRVPVLKDGKLVGIISRANLLQGLAAREGVVVQTPSPDDRSIRQQIIDLIEHQGWVTHGSLNVIVTDGVVELWGWVESEQERKAMLLAAQNVEGVRAVEDHLGSVAAWLWGA